MRCTCGLPADYGPSAHNGKRHVGICNRCYARLPLDTRHLFDPNERPFGASSVGAWLDRPPADDY